MDSVNSTTFIKRPPYMTDTQERYLYTKELLSGRIFLGSYVEKRYVAVLKEYRDVVFVNSEEIDLQHDLDKIRKKWLGVQDLKWVGITGPDEFGFPKAYCFWVNFTNLAIGQYWFQIKHVKLVDQEVVYSLKCIRKSQTPLFAVTPKTSEKFIRSTEGKIGKAGTSTSHSAHTVAAGIIAEFEPHKVISSVRETCAEAIQNLRPFLTVRNLFTILRVTCALTIAVVMGIISLIGYLGEYVLKLIREVTLLVNAFTPIVIQLIDFLSKIIGGLFILVAGMLRSGNHHPPQYLQPYRNPVFLSSEQTNRTGGGVPLPAFNDWRERNRILRQELFLTMPKRK